MGRAGFAAKPRIVWKLAFGWLGQDTSRLGEKLLGHIGRSLAGGIVRCGGIQRWYARGLRVRIAHVRAQSSGPEDDDETVLLHRLDEDLHARDFDWPAA